MSRMLKVNGYAGLVRDTSSGAIINRNKSAYLIAKNKVKEATKHKDQLRMAVREINTLKTDMIEIKNLLKTMVEKHGN